MTPAAAPPVDAAARWGSAGVRLIMGLLWLTNVGWKLPPDFGRDSGRGLYRFTSSAVEHEVFGPFAWIVREVVLPNFTIFGWMVLLVEALLGAFLLLGLATRFWAVVGMVQTMAIGLSVLNAPHEWSWSYYLMFVGHLAVLAAAAGRTFGLDALLRPEWARSSSHLARVLLRAS